MNTNLRLELPEVAYTTVGSEVYLGLTSRPKTLSPWLFYDAAGSSLFESITELPEYYLTRTERGILRDHADEIISAAAENNQLTILELGAGSAIKTGLLLRAAVNLQGSVVYHPIDVSRTALDDAKTRLESEIPQVVVKPAVADYTGGLEQIHLGNAAGFARRLVLYVGSSIGNFSPADALALLRNLRSQLLPEDRLLLGADNVKDTRFLLAAYNDAAGVTAQFNKNLLLRINRELEADFEPDLFRHKAIWNQCQSRIEMHLESLIAQSISIESLGLKVHFARGETIHTENSYKFTHERIAIMLSQAGFSLQKKWTDAAHWFGVYLAVAH